MSKVNETHLRNQDSSMKLSRRNVLRGLAVLGGGSLVSKAMPSIINSADQQDQRQVVSKQTLGYENILDKARERLYPICRVCPVCDGVACAFDSYGVTGTGTGMSFQNNFTSLLKVKFNMSFIHDVKEADPSTTIFGKKISFPAMAAPMGPSASRFGKGMPVMEWVDATVNGCSNAGTFGSLGENPASYREEDIKIRLEFLKQSKANAFYGIKPVPNPVILKWLPAIEESGAPWITIDIDHGPKSVTELRELVKASNIPIVAKGIMTLDAAKKCIDSGIAGIVVSNHGGRRMDYTLGTAEVLPAIAAKLKGKIPIFVDGCVQSGYEVLKYLALGADVVLVGRHILRAAYGGGTAGVTLFMNLMRSEFQKAMVQTGVSSVSQISSSIINIAI